MTNKLYEEQSIQAIANAIRNKNGKTDKYKVSQMPQAINEISSGIIPSGTISVTNNGNYDVTNYAIADVNVTGGGSSEQQYDEDWWNIKTILEEDTRNYTGKAIILYSNSDDFTNITISSPLVAVATSDGKFYTSTTTHIWDESKDKIASSDVEDTTPKYGTRYLILYFNTEDVTYTALNDFTIGSIYAVFKCNLTKSSTSTISASFFRSNRSLKYFDFIHGFSIKFGTNLSYFCNSCTSLVKLPDVLDTSNCTNLSYFCTACYSLSKLPDKLDTSKCTNFSNFCYNCQTLEKLPDNLDVSKCTNFSNFCYNCYSLVKVNIKLGSVSLPRFSDSNNLSISSLRYIADNAPTVTSATTLTIGSKNITRAGGSNGYVVRTLVSKGWTVN